MDHFHGITYAHIALAFHAHHGGHPLRETVLLRKGESKQSACFMVFTEGPIYKGLATSGRAENGSKTNFAMEPLFVNTLQ